MTFYPFQRKLFSLMFPVLVVWYWYGEDLERYQHHFQRQHYRMAQAVFEKAITSLIKAEDSGWLFSSLIRTSFTSFAEPRWTHQYFYEIPYDQGSCRYLEDYTSYCERYDLFISTCKKDFEKRIEERNCELALKRNQAQEEIQKYKTVTKNTQEAIQYLSEKLEQYKKNLPIVINTLEEGLKDVTDGLLELYTHCIDEHSHPRALYQRGKIYFDRGMTVDFVSDISKMVTDKALPKPIELSTIQLLQLGKGLNECNQYDQAILTLSKVIEKDPTNKDAFFERAIAYFETGNFEKALADYLIADIKPKKFDPKNSNFDYLSLSQGMSLGILNGSQDAVSEFLPCLLSCYQGISNGIWALVTDPLEVSKDMADASIACFEYIKNNTPKDIFYKLVPELQLCLNQWDQLDESTKGNYIGYVIGKYGVDIFAGLGSFKAMNIYRNLRNANAIMTLETAATSQKLAGEIIEQSLKAKVVRAKVLKSDNLKIQWDKQGKHIRGHRNYDPEKSKSIFTHENPQKLIDKYAGTGSKHNHGIPGAAGYKEVVDFGEIIGYDVHPGTGLNTPTTWGTIHYSKAGVHIVLQDRDKYYE